MNIFNQPFLKDFFDDFKDLFFSYQQISMPLLKEKVEDKFGVCFWSNSIINTYFIIYMIWRHYSISLTSQTTADWRIAVHVSSQTMWKYYHFIFIHIFLIPKVRDSSFDWHPYFMQVSQSKLKQSKRHPFGLWVDIKDFI